MNPPFARAIVVDEDYNQLAVIYVPVEIGIIPTLPKVIQYPAATGNVVASLLNTNPATYVYHGVPATVELAT